MCGHERVRVCGYMGVRFVLCVGVEECKCVCVCVWNNNEREKESKIKGRHECMRVECEFVLLNFDSYSNVLYELSNNVLIARKKDGTAEHDGEGCF